MLLRVCLSFLQGQLIKFFSLSLGHLALLMHSVGPVVQILPSARHLLFNYSFDLAQILTVELLDSQVPRYLILNDVVFCFVISVHNGVVQNVELTELLPKLHLVQEVYEMVLVVEI